MSNPMIAIENLSKLYHLGELHRQTHSFRDTVRGFFKNRGGKKADESIWALKDICLDIKQGEVVGIIGRNGAGKSTLLKILARITKPTKGRIWMNGHVASLLEVGTGFHPELTGRENIYLNGAILGMKKREIAGKFEQIVDFAGVEKFIDTPVKHYSSGMYVRLAFAVAAHLEPEILLVDEVLAVGDIAFQKKCLGKMQNVASQGRTVLFVSHQLGMIEALCPRCILLKNGHIANEGNSREVIDRYYASLRENEKNISLRDRTDRQGRGHFRFVDAWVESENGSKVERVNSGRPVKFVLMYEIAPEQDLKDISISIGIHALNNMFVTNLGTRSVGIELNFEKAACGRIECVIPKLSLNSGTFSYDLMAKNGKSDGEIEDYIVQVGMFDIDPGLFFKDGGVVPARVFMLMEHTWDHIEG
ncbi:MAG: ABC transporter ATP-binding protein [bacterium]